MEGLDVLTKKRLCKQIRQNTGHSYHLIESVVQQAIDLMGIQLAEGGKIEIENFLVLEVTAISRALPHSDENTVHHILKVRPGRALRERLRHLE
ncbi:MAG: HU family DNA-binding protein [Anaerolineae bacterium]|nr:HU family DNA-binding protein [Anaerolineae bacterium]